MELTGASAEPGAWQPRKNPLPALPGSSSPQPALPAVLILFLPQLLPWSSHHLFFSACKGLGIEN